jgi:hypothetical protein
VRLGVCPLHPTLAPLAARYADEPLYDAMAAAVQGTGDQELFQLANDRLDQHIQAVGSDVFQRELDEFERVQGDIQASRRRHDIDRVVAPTTRGRGAATTQPPQQCLAASFLVVLVVTLWTRLNETQPAPAWLLGTGGVRRVERRTLAGAQPPQQ